MNKDEIIERTVSFVKETLAEAEGGHDWWHIYRVSKLAKYIAQEEEGVDELIIELGALLHDIADSKFHDGDEEIGARTARDFLTSLNLDPAVIEHVENIVRHVSYSKSIEGQLWTSPELAVVQDADKLDALGAIGIARAFNYGGHTGRPLYDPNVKPIDINTKEDYKRTGQTTLNHFPEKLLLLKDKMKTKTGRKIAESRHQFMEEYLKEFHAEWEGEK